MTVFKWRRAVMRSDTVNGRRLGVYWSAIRLMRLPLKNLCSSQEIEDLKMGGYWKACH